MEQLTETINLDIDESNDLTFKIRLEGNAASPAKVRLVCEGKDISYMFNGYGTGEDEVVQFTLPKMDGKLSEGLYAARVEVLVDNKHFVPLNFGLNFRKSISVVAESMQVAQKTSRPEIRVTAAPVVTSKTRQQAQQQATKQQSQVVKFEQKTATPQGSSTSNSGEFESLRDSFERKLSPKTQQQSDSLEESTLRQITRALTRSKSGK